MPGTASDRRCQGASTRKGSADLAGNQGRCGTRRPFCRGKRVPMPPSRGLSSEGSGPQEGNSYAGVMGGSARLERRAVPRRSVPPRNTKCASLGTRSPGVHRGSPDCIWSRTARARSAAGYQTAGINLGNHSWYSARSRPSRSIGPPSWTVHPIRWASPCGASQKEGYGSVLATRGTLPPARRLLVHVKYRVGPRHFRRRHR
jgi:hypothetical protein